MSEKPLNDNVQSNTEISQDSITLLGVRVHKVTMDLVIENILRFLEKGGGHIIVTADASCLVIAQEDKDLYEIINSADIVTPDGTGILWGSKMLCRPLLSRVSGVDISRRLCELSAQKDFSIFFFGAAPGVAQAAADKMRQNCPGLKIAGVRHGYFKPEEEAEIVAEIAASGADVLLVALGIPMQEKFIKRNLDKLGVKVAMGVGGTFDVFSGKVERAPIWMQNHGLEWAYRLAQNPKKISKVATLPRFMLLIFKEKFSRKKTQ